jgi:HemY protein
MIRLVVFLVLVAAVAFGAAWIADQGGTLLLTWGGWRIETSVPVALVALLLLVAALLLIWSLLSGLVRMPKRLRRRAHERRHARARHAITHGLLAIGTGDGIAARRHAAIARRDANTDPLTLLLHAQAAQLEGDRAGARRAFQAMAQRSDTRVLGLRGLFVEAQRADDGAGALALAEEALKIAPASPWAAHAVLGFRCAAGDWDGAMGLVAAQYTAGRIDKAQYHREKGVLLTARALEIATDDRDRARELAYEAVKLAPTLTPAAVLAGRFLSEAHQVRRAMRVLETAWLAEPHPDLAEAYAHVRIGDSARARLGRVETLAAKTPDHIEGALAVARAAREAGEFARARAALAPFVAAPTQRVALLMAEIERAENGDSGEARAWTLRAVRAAHDPAWTADGYVSDRWRPVSPVSGRIDAFRWQTPVAALPREGALDLSAEIRDLEAAQLAAPRPVPAPEILAPGAEPVIPEPAPAPDAATPAPGDSAAEAPATAAPAEGPVKAAAEPLLPLAVADPAAGAVLPVEPGPGVAAAPAPAPASPPAAEDTLPGSDGAPVPEHRPAPAEPVPPPLFRARGDLKTPVAPVIPLVRPPDDPGVDDGPGEENYDPLYPPQAQRGGWRGFLNRWGG